MNSESKLKLWWVGAHRKKECIFCNFKFVQRNSVAILWLILYDYESSFVKLLPANNDITNQQRNTQSLLTEVFKKDNNLARPSTSKACLMQR